MRVLVVDDMGAMRMNVKKNLDALGFKDILTANNGKQAFDKIIAVCDLPGKRIDLCVSDWNMEPVNGLQLLKMLRNDKRAQNIFFIMLTAEQGSENVVAALRAGVDEYIIKPFNLETLKRKIESLTAKKLEVIDKEVSRFLKEDESDKEVDSFENNKAERLVKFFRARYQKLLSLTPWSSMTPMSMGAMYMRFRKFKNAEKWLRNVIAIDFGHHRAHSMLSKAMRAQGKLAESVKQLEVALATNPGSPEIRRKLGEAYLKEGNFEKAIVMLAESFKQTLKKGDDIKTAANLNSLGQAKIFKGETDMNASLIKEGAQDLEGAVTLDPELISAQYNLMTAYKKIGREKMALEALDRIKQMEPEDAEGWLALGKAFLDSDEKSKGLFAFKNAEKMAKTIYDVLERISYALYENQHFKNALEFNVRAKAANPSAKQSYNQAGLIHRAMGNHKLAIEEYQRSIEIDPGDGALYYNVGVAFVKSGQAGKAEEYFNKAVEIAPLLKEKIDGVRQAGERA